MWTTFIRCLQATFHMVFSSRRRKTLFPAFSLGHACVETSYVCELSTRYKSVARGPRLYVGSFVSGFLRRMVLLEYNRTSFDNYVQPYLWRSLVQLPQSSCKDTKVENQGGPYLTILLTYHGIVIRIQRPLGKPVKLGTSSHDLPSCSR